MNFLEVCSHVNITPFRHIKFPSPRKSFTMITTTHIPITKKTAVVISIITVN